MVRTVTRTELREITYTEQVPFTAQDFINGFFIARDKSCTIEEYEDACAVFRSFMDAYAVYRLNPSDATHKWALSISRRISGDVYLWIDKGVCCYLILSEEETI